MNFDPNKLYQKTIDAGNDWADKKAAADTLEESKKSVLAEIMLKQQCNSNVEAETKARASQEYRDFIETLSKAKHAENKAKVKYDAIKTYCAHMQTLNANLRAEMRLGGLQT